MSSSFLHRKQLNWWLVSFLIIELLCLAGFCCFMNSDDNMMAIIFLFGPLQILLWLFLVQKIYYFLVLLAVFSPLAVNSLIPNFYHRFILYPVTIVFLLFLRFTGFVSPDPHKEKKLLPVDKLTALLLVIWILVSFIVALSRGNVHRFFITCNVLILEAFIIGYFFATTLENARQIKLLIIAILVGNICSVLPLPQLVRLSVGFIDSLGGKRLSTPFGVLDLNALGLLTSTSAVAVLGLFLGQKKGGVRLLLGISLVLLILGLIFSRSRGAWFGFGIAVLYLIIKTRSFILTVLTGSAGLLILVTNFFRNLLLTRLASTNIYDPALLGRFLLWLVGLRVAKQNWLFGVGWENFRFIKFNYGYPRFGDPKFYFSTHNLYLETLVGLGGIGFLLFTFLLWGLIVRTDRVFTKTSAEYRYLALSINAALIAFATHNLFDSLSSTFIVIGMWFGMAMALQRLTGAARVITLSSSRPEPEGRGNLNA